MKQRTSIKGYTLAEVIIGMLISIMVVGFALSTSFFIKSRYTSLSGGYLVALDFIRLKDDLVRNFEESDEVFYADSTLTFSYVNKATIHYLLRENYMIREQTGVLDTFNLTPKGVLFKCKPETELITEFVLRVGANSDKDIYLYKYYPIDVFMQNITRGKEGEYGERH